MYGLFDSADLTGIRYFPNYAGLANPMTAGGAKARGPLTGPAALQPIVQPADTNVGAFVKTFGNDFYDRIHVSTFDLNVGTVVASQVRTLSIWNAWRTFPKTLQTFGQLNADGIVVSGQPPTPLTFTPLQERTYTITITAAGPPTVNASLIYTFADGTVLDVSVVGRRAVAWLARPNWDDFVTERMDWLTDVLPAKYGKEQRRSLRIGPRKVYEFSFVLPDQARRIMENAMLGWGVRPFVLPLWPEGHPLLAPLVVGNTVIPAVTKGKQYGPGTLVMLMQPWGRFEIAEVLSITDSAVTLKNGLAQDWPVGTKVYPAITAILESGVTLNRLTDTLSEGDVSFRSVESIDLLNPGVYSPTLYLTKPVLTRKPSESSDPTTNYARDMVLVESMSGRDFIDDVADLSRITQSHRWMLEGNDNITELRSLFYSLKGKWKSLWVPTFRQDLLVVTDVEASQTYLEVEDSQLTELAAGREGRKHIRIETTSGVYYRQIDSVARMDANTERVFFASGIPAATKAQVIMVSYMMLARMQADSISFGWHHDNLMEAEASFMSIVDYTVAV